MSTTLPPQRDSGAAEPSGTRPATDSASSRTTGWGRRLLGWIPPLLVFGGLAAFGYWGHHTGWTIPKVSVVAGNAEPVKADWCEDHSVPESRCVECNPGLYPPPEDFGWCREHGVQQCPLDHPEVAEVDVDPQELEKDRLRAERALALRPRDENGFGCGFYRKRIQFASHEAVQKAGVDVDLVMRAPVVETIEASGEIRYDQTRLARLSSKAAGTVWRVDAQLGDRVRQGDVLALIDAAEVGRLKTEMVETWTQWEFQRETYSRLAPLVKQGSVPELRALESKAGVREAWTRIRRIHQALVNLGLPFRLEELEGQESEEVADYLHFLGLPESIRNELDPATTPSNLIPLRAPLDGVVVDRDVVSGEVVETSEVLFTVADNDRMWLLLNVPLEESSLLQMGLPVEFEADGMPNAVTGELTWLSTTVDAKTRTVLVRAELDNSDGRLRDETFGTGRIILREESDAIVVPEESIHWEGCCHIAFVRNRDYFEESAPKVFEIRTVRPGVTQDGKTEIIAGVLPGEVIVTSGSSVLRSQLLRGNLGEGCCAE
ncbi:Cobalt-zinc-cadmium resistance protein CzcB [Maioricimonas rarisocia]|uniref:Cobalt-zinc-cadmium resistance protein CzcB n=1 Tax=Maioricimonas rarisocia TaxID=2528026 RepID=A0A517Z6B7_9PLAN|nr:efflux RND transporter periplasmic adaptor subunit [Maioricimonas rarisocia]QDU38032.1 Cobalt-zinc-cadmium resistance protein CzcB [Maioricimonas rarisocia]